MGEYISKQSVIDYLEGYLNSIGECGADSLLFDRGQRRALINSIQDISAVKAADVQPVKHGRWEHGECSVCGASPLDHVSGDMYVEVDYYPNYCPSCGSQNADLWVDDESVSNEEMRPDNEVM